MKKPSVRDVAAAADVSEATVDRVLHGRPGVREKTRRKVEAAFNALASGALREGSDKAARQSLTVGVVFDSSATFVEGMQRSIERVAESTGWTGRFVIRDCSNSSLPHVADVLEKTSGETDGVIFNGKTGELISETINRIVESGKPLICVSSDFPGTKRTAYVGMDQTVAGRVAARWMGSCCRPSDGSLALHISHRTRAEYDREMGFRSLIRERFNTFEIIELENMSGSDDEAEAALKRVYAGGVKIAGIYSTCSGLAGLVRAIDAQCQRGSSRQLLVGHEFIPKLRSLVLTDKIDALVAVNNIDVIRQALWRLQQAVQGSQPVEDHIFTPELIFKENLQRMEWV